MAFNPDLVYLRTREDLLRYEDARFNALMVAVANFYLSRNEHTIWGEILRAVAIELGRLEYLTAYDQASKDPQYLTPADIKRRYASPLFVSNQYPGYTQYDLDYKDMFVKLIPAYQQGATVAAMAEIILAYTKQNVIIQELYKLVDFGYDFTDHNTVKAAINYNVIDINQMQQITSSLYRAVDLDKPAHVGLDLISRLIERDLIASDMTDFLRIYFRVEEKGTWEDIFTQSPLYGLPETQLSSPGTYVGKSFDHILTTAQYNSLMSVAWKREYEMIPNSDPSLVTYVLREDCYMDIATTDSVTGAFTGEIVKAGILAPRIEDVWEVSNETLEIFELT